MNLIVPTGPWRLSAAGHGRRNGCQYGDCRCNEIPGCRSPPDPADSRAINVLTYQYDNTRAGATAETVLTPLNVNVNSFGKLLPNGRRLRLRPAALSRQRRYGPTAAGINVVYVATEHDSVYAFDVDRQEDRCGTSTSSTPWRTSPRTVCRLVGCDQIIRIGIIARRGPTTSGTIYVVVTTQSRRLIARLHALDVATGRKSRAVPW